MAINAKELQDWQNKLNAIDTNVEYLELFKPNKEYIIENKELLDIFVEKKHEVLQDTFMKHVNQLKDEKNTRITT